LGISRHARLYESQKQVDNIKADGFANNIKIWKDKYDKEHVTVEQHRLEKEVFESYADSIAKLLGIKSKQIESLTQVNTSLNVTAKGKDIKKDSTIAYVPTKRDSTGKVIDSVAVVKQVNFKWEKGLPWLYIQGSIGEVDSVNVSGKDSLNFTNYWNRSWFLGPKHYYTDAKNSNPYIKLTGARTVQPIVREPRWLIAPSATVGWNGTPVLLPGISIIYYPLSIKIK
jgi:hypothetical protein